MIQKTAEEKALLKKMKSEYKKNGASELEPFTPPEIEPILTGLMDGEYELEPNYPVHCSYF